MRSGSILTRKGYNDEAQTIIHHMDSFAELAYVPARLSRVQKR